jgi:hypothetical protein
VSLRLVSGLVGFVVLALAAPAHAAFPGANGKLAIGAIGNAGRADIFTMNPDGGGLANLTNNPAYDGGAS